MRPTATPIDCLVKGDVTLTVYRYTDSLNNVYRIRAGVALLELNEAELADLTDVLVDFAWPREFSSPRRRWWSRKR